MVVTIKKNAPASAIDDALEAIANQPKPAKKGFDPKKYAGKLKRGLDGLEYQRTFRDEWN